MFSAAVSVAQTTGMVEGTVTDQSGGALPGVTVEIASPSLQGTRLAATSASGAYRFPTLPPGAYTITASLPGLGETQKTATVTLDATATVNLSLALSTTAEVTVTGEAPLVDSTATTTGTNYTANVISRLPLGRNYADVVFTQPGVQADFGETQGRSLAISIYGSTSAENLFLIDGINTTNVIKGFQGKDINTEFIQEVEVKTGGYQAEYGRNTGGIVNVITKSGGNEFHGDVFGYYNDTGMRADPVNGDPAQYDTPIYSGTGSAQANNYILSKDVRQEWGLDLGGFMVKDKVWFFGAYDRAQVNQNLQTLDPTNTETFGHQFPRSVVQSKYSGKITVNPFQSTSIVGTVFSDAQTQDGALKVPSTLDPTSYLGRQDVGGPDYGARLNQLFGSSGHLHVPVLAAQGPVRDDASRRREPACQRLHPVPDGLDLRCVRRLRARERTDTEQLVRGEAYAGSFTAYPGNHEIKVGGDYSNDSTSGSYYYTGQQVLAIRPCNVNATSKCKPDAPLYTNRQGKTLPVFYQHTMLMAGTASDYVPVARGPLRYADQTLQRVPPGPVEDPSLPDGEPRRAVGHGELLRPGPHHRLLQGVLAAEPVVASRRRDVGFRGRRHLEAVRFGGPLLLRPADGHQRPVFTAFSLVSTYNYDPVSTVQDPAAPRNELFRGGDASGIPVDPGMKASYQDELTVGVEKALDPTLSIGLKGTYRTLGRTIEDRCDLDYNDPLTRGTGCALINPGSDGVAASGGIASCNGSGNPFDPTAGQCGLPGVPAVDARRIFRGIELTARKQFTNQLWAQASFLYSSLRGNYSGAISEATGQTDPGINNDYDYYQFADQRVRQPRARPARPGADRRRL